MVGKTVGACLIFTGIMVEICTAITLGYKNTPSDDDLTASFALGFCFGFTGLLVYCTSKNNPSEQKDNTRFFRLPAERNSDLQLSIDKVLECKA